MPEPKKARVRPRKFVMVELTDSEREKLERLKANRGERATLAGTIRNLIKEAKK